MFSDTGAQADTTGSADAGAGGAEAGEGTAPTGGAQGAPAAAGTGQGSGNVPQQLTAQDIAKAIKDAGVGAPTPVQQQQQQYTQEDFDKAFQTFQPNAEIVSKLLAGGDGAIQAMHAVRDGVVKQAVTMAAYIVQDRLEKFANEHKPNWERATSYVTKREQAELRDEFYTAHKDLEPYDQIVTAAVQQLKGEGKTFETKEAGFKAAAERTREIMKKIPGLTAQPSAEGQAASSQNPTRMPTLSRGGQGGSGKGSNGSPGAKDPSHSIFG